MKPVQSLLVRVAAVLVGSAIIGASVASNPATAQDVNQMLAAIGLTTCSKSTPCKVYKNNGSGAGIQGIGKNGNGVIAQSTNGSATYSASTNADGVQAYSSNNDGTNSGTNNPSASDFTGRSGVWGHDDSTDGGTLNVGVAGSSTNGTGMSGSSTNGTGVSGSSNYVGVLGTSPNTGVEGSGFFGVYGTSGTAVSVDAVSPTGNTAQTLQVIGGTAGDSNLNVATFNSNLSFMFGVDNSGNAHVAGLIYTGGVCSSGCDRTRGDRVVSYAAQSSMPTLEDVGAGQLVNGVAHVLIDASLARAIDHNTTYAVFVEPEGPNHGLYVTQKTATGFTVAENPGGSSTIPFSYRIVAKPFGVYAARLPVVAGTSMPKAILPKAASRRRH
ncbi:MAG TPA: hypothetical protein VJN22_01165 [Candidatus Eremiobacteraceae bacterium]|nr:hypothetical protein [Candidatus Eremiobacteraceae bacterium]